MREVLQVMTDLHVITSTDDERTVALVCVHLCECVAIVFTLVLMKGPTLRCQQLKTIV